MMGEITQPTFRLSAGLAESGFTFKARANRVTGRIYWWRFSPSRNLKRFTSLNPKMCLVWML